MKATKTTEMSPAERRGKRASAALARAKMGRARIQVIANSRMRMTTARVV
jgi:hypothetical protein